MTHHRIEVTDLHYAYPDGTKALNGVDFLVHHGESIAVVGANGAGKSTLLAHLVGLHHPQRGTVVVGDTPVSAATLPDIRRSVGMVFQDPDDQLFMPTVAEDVAFGPLNLNLPSHVIEQRVSEALERVGASALRDRPPYRLSGGEKRAVAIATVLAMEPSVLVLDEPSSNLDPRARRRLIGLLRSFAHTKLIATHDLDLALDVCDRTIVIDAGRVVADGPTREVFANQPLLESCGLEKPLAMQACPACGDGVAVVDRPRARFDDLLDMCGNVAYPTPLVRLNRIPSNPENALLMKCEWVNPFGSIKDRTAKWLLKGLAERGELEGRTVIEATSGNTGIALAAICGQMGIPMVATAPHVLSPEKTALLRAFGADVRLTDPNDDSGLHPMDVAFRMAEAIRDADPDRYVMPNQYDNADNARAHYESTGPEIWAQTEGRIRYFFAGLGTCGTMVGTSRYLKEQNPDVRCIAIEPVRGHHISGLKNMEETAVPANLDMSVIDEIVWVDDEMTDECARRLYREEALMVGPSAAAIAAGALKYLAEPGREGLGVCIAPDSGQKATTYLNEILG